MGIADTLIEISHESSLNKAEKESLRLIAKEIKKLEGYKEGAKDCLRSAKNRIKDLEELFDELIFFLEYVEANHEPRTSREWIDRLQALKDGK